MTTSSHLTKLSISKANRGSEPDRSATAIAILLFIAVVVVDAMQARGEPLPGIEPANVGRLVVYSATDEFDDGDVRYHPHSAYIIHNANGTFFKKIDNHIDRGDELPEVVSLPAGQYFIDARSEYQGSVRFVVMVHAGQLTVVNLEARPDVVVPASAERAAGPRRFGRLEPANGGSGVSRATAPAV